MLEINNNLHLLIIYEIMCIQTENSKNDTRETDNLNKVCKVYIKY